MRSVIPRPNSFRALAKRRFRALPPSTSTFLKKHFLDGCIKDEGETPCVGDVRPLVSPAEGDGDLRPGATAGVGDDVFRVDGEHLTGGGLPISSALGSGEALKDGGDHFVMILEGVVVLPRWSMTSGFIVIVVVLLFGIELLSQAKAVFHLVLAILVEGHGPLRICLYYSS